MELEHYIKHEQAKALYKNLVLIIVGTLGVVAVTAWVFWPVMSRTTVLLWIAAAVVINGLRWLSCYRFDPEQELTPQAIQARLNLHVFWGFMVGLHWGFIPLLFLTGEVTVYTLFATSVYTGFVSSAMSTDTAYFPSFFSFALPSSIMFVGRALYEGGDLYIALAILVTFFLVMLSYLSLNAQAFFREARELNFQNLSLMGELRNQKETAENATMAKDQFLAAASHDLRQPLNAIALFMNALGSVDMEAKGRAVVEKIQQSLIALNSMLHGMLDISRLDSSAIENNPEDINLSILSTALIAEYHTKADSKGLNLMVDIPSETWVTADPVLIQRVLRNLLDNAIKYTPQGSVSVVAKPHELGIEVTVIDTGVGIPKDQQQRVFEEFHQLNNPERDRQKGLGLGLAIVKRLCALMQVPMILESTPEAGTQVKLLLKQGKPVAASCSALSHQEGSLENFRVAVVDDERDILLGMQSVLAGWGCFVVVAENTADCLNALHQQNCKPDALLVDFRLRDNVNGIDVIELIREEYNRVIPAIIITGDTSPSRLREVADANVDVLYKPLDPVELKQKLLTLVSH